MSYQQFIFDSYHFDADGQTLTLNYTIDDALHFTETYTFNFPFVSFDTETLDRAVQLLFFMAGVSYYKTYLPREIIIKSGSIDATTAAFLARTWQQGLGEFFYVNKLNPNSVIPFRATDESVAVIKHDGEGMLVGLGGGKDSLVSVELLRTSAQPVTTWALNHEKQLQPLVDEIDLPHLSVSRQWDTQLISLNDHGAYNGHVPISAIFACVGVVAAILSGKRDVVVSNEQSANEPTLTHNGTPINHQYSKSQVFEQDFQTLLTHHFGDTVRYYSLLRPFSELYIAELFAGIGFDKYQTVFSSCNRAYVHASNAMIWCGACAKCAFVFMILTPFVKRAQLELVFSGKNMLLDPTHVTMYKKLLGISGEKPLDCVGEIKESRTAMQLCFKKYPQLAEIYSFTVPESYDYTKYMDHELPSDVEEILQRALHEIRV